jgi:hypothetical protein
MITIIEIYSENNAWYVKYLLNNYTHITEPLPTEETARSVSELLLNNS